MTHQPKTEGELEKIRAEFCEDVGLTLEEFNQIYQDAMQSSYQDWLESRLAQSEKDREEMRWVIIRWWEQFRPAGRDAIYHATQCPAINTVTKRDKDLALLAASLTRKEQCKP